MPGFRLTTLARSDMIGIGRYSEKSWGLNQRNAYLSQIDRCFHMLAENPSIGRSYGHIMPGCHAYPVNNHIIFYRMADHGIDILRILHERMDIPAHLITE